MSLKGWDARRTCGKSNERKDGVEDVNEVAVVEVKVGYEANRSIDNLLRFKLPLFVLTLTLRLTLALALTSGDAIADKL